MFIEMVPVGERDVLNSEQSWKAISTVNPTGNVTPHWHSKHLQPWGHQETGSTMTRPNGTQP